MIYTALLLLIKFQTLSQKTQPVLSPVRMTFSCGRLSVRKLISAASSEAGPEINRRQAAVEST